MAASPLSPAAFAQTVWVNTATQAITLSKLDTATDMGPAESSEPLTVRLALNLRNKSALENYVKAINEALQCALRKRASPPSEFTASYGPTPPHKLDQVVSYLKIRLHRH